MSVFDKLKFWKKEDELDFDALVSKEMSKTPEPFGEPTTERQQKSYTEKYGTLGREEQSPFEEPFTPSTPEAPSFQSRREAPMDRDRELELINSKLDTIRAILSSMEQRMANLERNSPEQKQQRLW